MSKRQIKFRESSQAHKLLELLLDASDNKVRLSINDLLKETGYSRHKLQGLLSRLRRAGYPFYVVSPSNNIYSGDGYLELITKNYTFYNQVKTRIESIILGTFNGYTRFTEGAFNAFKAKQNIISNGYAETLKLMVGSGNSMLDLSNETINKVRDALVNRN